MARIISQPASNAAVGEGDPLVVAYTIQPATAEPRGEYTLVVGPPPPPDPETVDDAAASRELERALAEGHPLAEARRVAAARLGISRRDLYELLKTNKG